MHMAVSFEFVAEKGFHFTSALGNLLGTPEADDRVYLPPHLGKGYIREIYPGNDLSLCFHHYRLEQEFVLKRLPGHHPSDKLILKFECKRIAGDTAAPASELLFEPGSEAELGTANFFTEITFPAHRDIDFLVITADRQALADLLQPDTGDIALKTDLLSNPSFVINIQLTADMERVLKEFHHITPEASFSHLLYRAKALEIIYLFFSKLMARAPRAQLAIHRADVEKIYNVRAILLKDLSVVPSLSGLARDISMSPTKMKVLFRQVFGDAIYSYYQAARMQEAARLLKDYSVSETGYKLGFSNLSHFSRLFERYFHFKPKKFREQYAGTTEI